MHVAGGKRGNSGLFCFLIGWERNLALFGQNDKLQRAQYDEQDIEQKNNW